MPFGLINSCWMLHETNPELKSHLQEMQEKELRRKKHLRARETPTINCESWTIIRKATDEDKRKAKAKILNRLKNAFWL